MSAGEKKGVENNKIKRDLMDVTRHIPETQIQVENLIFTVAVKAV
jgi:hypothetical protein